MKLNQQLIAKRKRKETDHEVIIFALRRHEKLKKTIGAFDSPSLLTCQILKNIKEVPLSRRRGHKISSNRAIIINVIRKRNKSKREGQQNLKNKNQHQQSHKNKDWRSLGKTEEKY